MSEILTRMNEELNCFTAIELDWTYNNLIGLQTAIRRAYDETRALVDPAVNPQFNTPNQWFLAGVNRFGFVDYHLQKACDEGLIVGITPVWQNLSESGRGMSALELRGMYTSVLAHHLHEADDLPRESRLRAEKRLFNHVSPLFPSMDNTPATTHGLINLLLVHGDKGAEFAYLRAYDNPADPQSFIPFGGNIMSLVDLKVADIPDQEEVPELILKPKMLPVAPVPKEQAN